MAGGKVRFSVARVVSQRPTTGTSSVAMVCCGDLTYAHPSLQNGAVQRDEAGNGPVEEIDRAASGPV